MSDSLQNLRPSGFERLGEEVCSDSHSGGHHGSQAPAQHTSMSHESNSPRDPPESNRNKQRILAPRACVQCRYVAMSSCEGQRACLHNLSHVLQQQWAGLFRTLLVKNRVAADNSYISQNTKEQVRQELPSLSSVSGTGPVRVQLRPCDSSPSG